MPKYTRVAAAGQRVKLLECGIGKVGNVLKEERSLRCDALHVGILVLHDPGHERIVDVPQLRHAAAGLTEQQPLGGGRRLDNVLRQA